jgi:hypothetical protein
LYEIETKALNRVVKRNIERFPDFFMFQLTEGEFNSLRYQIGTSKEGRGGRRYLPYVFTEHGVLMLSSVLNSKKAIEVNIEIMKIFVKMRKLVGSQTGLQEQINELKKVFLLQVDYTESEFKYYNEKIKQVITALNYFTEDRTLPERQIGFNADIDVNAEIKKKKQEAKEIVPKI